MPLAAVDKVDKKKETQQVSGDAHRINERLSEYAYEITLLGEAAVEAAEKKGKPMPQNQWLQLQLP